MPGLLSVLESAEHEYGQRRHYQRQTVAGYVQINDRVHGALLVVGDRFGIAEYRALAEIGQAPSVVLVAYPTGVSCAHTNRKRYTGTLARTPVTGRIRVDGSAGVSRTSMFTEPSCVNVTLTCESNVRQTRLPMSRLTPGDGYRIYGDRGVWVPSYTILGVVSYKQRFYVWYLARCMFRGANISEDLFFAYHFIT